MSGVHKRQSGLTLIELMVAVTVSLVAMLLMFKTYTIADRARRNAASGNDGQRSGLIALDRVSFLVGNAGDGMAQVPGSFNCPMHSWFNGTQTLPTATLPAPFASISATAFRAAPVLVFDGGSSPDVLFVMAGNSPSANVAIDDGKINADGMLYATSTMALQRNDILMLTRMVASADGTLSSADCYLTQVGVADNDVDVTTSYINTNPFSISGASHSAPAGTLPVNQRNTLSTLGPNPSFLMLGVLTADGRSNLVSYDLVSGAGPIVIAENVLDFQVLYGVDTTVKADRAVGRDNDYFGDGSVDAWVAPTGDWSAASLTSVDVQGKDQWNGAERQRRIKAVRLGIVTADTETERGSVDRPAGSAVTLFANAGDANQSASHSLQIAHSIGTGAYASNRRFHTFETQVGIRNLSSGLSPIQASQIYDQ